jgi:hypothetical protein
LQIEELPTGNTLNQTNLLQNLIVKGMSSIAGVDSWCDCAVEVVHTVSLQQVTQVNAPGAAHITEQAARKLFTTFGVTSFPIVHFHISFNNRNYL